MSERSVRVKFRGGMSGRLFKVKGSGRWYFAYWHLGREYRETTKTADLDDAKVILRGKLDYLARVRGGEPFVAPEAKRITVAELLDALASHFTLRAAKGLRQVLSHVKPIREAFGPWRAVDVTPEAVDRTIQRWLSEGVAPATCNRRTQLLGQAFSLGHDRHRVVTVPKFRSLEVNNARRGFVTPEQFEAIASHLDDPLDDLARLGYAIGWRRGELTALTAANVDLRAGELRIHDSKNGDGRVVPLRTEDGRLNAIGQILERRMAARVVGNQVVPWVFHRGGKRVVDFRRAWETACQAAGLPGVLFHDLRRSFAKDAVDCGNDYKTVMDLAGWKTVAVFHRYKIVDTRQMATALNRLETARTTAPTPSVVIPLTPALGARSR